MALQAHKSHAIWVLNGRKFLSEQEIRRLLRSAERRKVKALQSGQATAVKDWFLMLLAAETGLRVQEIADLHCGDIQDHGDWPAVLVRHGKGGRPRVVTVRRQFLVQFQEFTAWKQSQGESVSSEDPIFMGRGKAMCKRALQKAFERSMYKARIKRPAGMGIHSLRHTYASFLLKASKFNLRLVQKQLGHASMKTTEVYAQVFDPDIRKAVDKLYE